MIMPILNTSVVIVSGTIKIYMNKKWKQRFCVIAKLSPFASTPKLFVYKETTDYKKSLDLLAQLPYDTVYGLDSVSNSDKSPVRSAIVLTCEDRIVLLGFNNYSELVFWLEKICDSVQDASYRARFVKCESVGKSGHQQALLLASPDGSSGSGTCASGDGRLHVQPSRLCFYTEPAEACKSLAVWPLEFVKRYMVNEAMACFVFEGDIGCGKFRGMQYFQCERRFEAYADMKAACVNKPMPSLSQSRGGATNAAAPGDDPRRPASSCIDIPQPRGGQHPEPRSHQRSERRHHRHCGRHREQHLQLRLHQHQPCQQLKVDSGYEGGGGSAGAAAPPSGALFPYFEAAQSPAAGDEAATAAVAGSREYYNLMPGNRAAAAMTGPRPGSECPGQLPGEFSRSLSVSTQPEHFQKNSACGPCRSRLVRSSTDVRSGDTGARGASYVTIDAAAAIGDPGCDCECDDVDECDCSDGWCCSGSDGQQLPWARPTVAAASCADVRNRKPRHGFEYASRERVASAFCGGDGGCYANLQHLQESQLCQQPLQPNCRSAPATDNGGDVDNVDADAARQLRHHPLLTYAKLDHSASFSAAPVADIHNRRQHQQPQLRLNYTEVDHWKTSAFREIAAERSRPPTSRSVSASSGGGDGSGSGGGGGGGRRSLIRIFQRGTSLRTD